ncbi:hypothetical protein ACFQH6_12335 [Halobacteriaceae archaeon GCM10025711]
MTSTGILAKVKALLTGGSEADEGCCCCGMVIEETNTGAGRGD